MSSLVYLIPLALLLGGAALAAFLWSLRSGQYDDLDGAAERIFLDADSDSAGGEPDASSRDPSLRGNDVVRPLRH